ncbi:hypothetical protein CDV36_015942 [Fusarium kuroshium]|uniref:Extracellular membrane protein CFEM domain-containing protein n=2 Tax=Fusarium solani species complex TaxID=232080 RepID=A0A3M2R3J3_9HYPO|nr:hypothetical protein CDV36_015942 [Fusarium kuroshium]RSL43691.1 hypothetical protein CEP51_016330 [Fusarium floridanum]
MALRFIPVLLLGTPILSQTVTITKDIPVSAHRCVRQCLYLPYNARTDLGDVLECGAPYQEECFCPTDVSRAEIVSRHIDDCAKESCSRGDLTQDVESMRSHYATYCIEKGYTAELVEGWYTSADADASSTAAKSETTSAETGGRVTSGDQSTPTIATTTLETGEAETTTRTAAATATTSDDGRDANGLPDIDFEGNDDSGALALRAGLMLLWLVPLAALFQWA